MKDAHVFVPSRSPRHNDGSRPVGGQLILEDSTIEISISVKRRKEVSSRSDHARKLIAPGFLRLDLQMSEH